MASKKAIKTMAMLLVVLALIVVVELGMANKLDEDQAECADKLVGLTTCLPYVGGEAKSPTVECCTGLKQVVENSNKCLCVLLKDRDNPNLGLNLNSTLALHLPTACHVPSNISKCVDLLHLAPNSSDAKMFEGLADGNGKSTSTPLTSGNSTSDHGSNTSSDEKSDGGIGKTCQRILELAFGTLIGFWAPQLVLHV